MCAIDSPCMYYEGIAELNAYETSTTESTQGLTTFDVVDVVSSQVVQDNRGAAGLHPDSAVSLTEFLARPVKIQTITVLGAGTSLGFNAFASWRAVASIREKISRYGYIRGNLKLTFVANGNPYQYGEVIIAGRAVPIDVSSSSNFDWPKNRTSWVIADITGDGYAQFFQIPHVVIDPGAEVNTTLTVPLMSTSQWIPLCSTLPNEPVQVFWVCPAFSNASGAALTPLIITVYASLENAEVTVPVLQAQSAPPERKQGGVYQQAASAMADAVASLRPIVGSWVTPAEAALRLGSRVAAALGFSRPMIVDTSLTTVLPANYAQTSGRLPGVGLYSDPLRAVAVDPTVAGYGSESDMEFSSIVSRWGLSGAFNVATTNVAGDVLYSAWANPFQVPNHVAGLDTVYLPTPIGYFAAIFATWGGGLEYKFVIHASSFHKGTIRIAYDPTGLATPAQVAAADPSLLKTTIAHVNGSTEILFQVPWTLDNLFVDTATFANASLGGNGRVHVIVDTPLQCNGVVAPVKIDVFIRGMSDFRVGPSSTRIAGLYAPVLQAQSLVTQTEAPFLVTYGERVVSLGNLLKRLSHAFEARVDLGSVAVAGLRYAHVAWPAAFPIRSAVVDDYDAKTQPCTLTSWFEAMYLVQRGGYRMGVIRRKIQDDNAAAPAVETSDFTIGSYQGRLVNNFLDLSMPGATSRTADMTVLASGRVSTSFDQMGGVVEVAPTHHGYFRVANAGMLSGFFPPAFGTSSTDDGCVVAITYPKTLSDTSVDLFSVYQGAADDYRLYCFDIVPALILL